MAREIGYHYTSRENWRKIRASGGLKQYLTRKPELAHWFPDGFVGIWLWKNNPEGLSHAGNVMWQVSTKKSTVIVKLQVQYDPRDQLVFNGHKINVFHKGHLGEMIYHQDEQGLVIARDIPLRFIKLIGTYNTVQRLQ